MKLLLGVLLAAGAGWLLAQDLEDIEAVPLDHQAIRYNEAPLADPVAKLQDQIAKGKVKLEYARGRGGYLPSLLKLLDINTDSQVLVFSQTSFHPDRVSPARPRAIYFNDTVSVGFVQGNDVLEMTSLDPKEGIIFYTLDAAESPKPEFGRRQDCLLCHRGPQTLAIPGRLVSSLFPMGERGSLHSRSYITDGRTPLERRWGGWYVTGNLGSQKHLGNVIPGPVQPEATNFTTLDGKLDLSPYLARTSDVVALMTLEHQTRMTNLMIRVGWDTRIALADGKLDAERAHLDSAIDLMVTYMTFADEAPIHETIQGSSTFTKTFAQRGPRDKQGRSLRDFDLRTRLFRYPLSYMIYSEAFDALPAPARDRIYQRLYDVLSGKDTDKKFAHLSAEDRRAAFEILRDTKPDLPSYWR